EGEVPPAGPFPPDFPPNRVPLGLGLGPPRGPPSGGCPRRPPAAPRRRILDAAGGRFAHPLHHLNDLFDSSRGQLGAAAVDDVGRAPGQAQNPVVGDMPCVAGMKPAFLRGGTVWSDIGQELRCAKSDDSILAMGQGFPVLIHYLNLSPRQYKASCPRNAVDQVKWRRCDDSTLRRSIFVDEITAERGANTLDAFTTDSAPGE